MKKTKLSEEELKKRRSQAAKKAAATRRRNAEADRKAALETKHHTSQLTRLVTIVIALLAIIALFLLGLAIIILLSGNTPTPIATSTQIVLPTATPFQPAADTPTPAVVYPVVPPTEAPVVIPPTPDLFESPVETTSIFNDESSWIIAEPGVIGDSTTAWTVAQVETPYHQNVPEGAFAFFSLGKGDIAIDGVTLHLPGAKGLNYLVVIRGSIDDLIVDNDLNKTAVVTDFVTGHAIWAYLPKGAYVSKDWIYQQMVASTTEGFTNCGAEGCSHLKIVLFDVDSHLYQMFEVHADDLDTWQLIEAGNK